MSLLDSSFKLNLGEGAFYAAFGLVFVVLGIVLLVLVFTGLGALMERLKKRKAASPAEKAEVKAAPAPEEKEEVTPELVAAITAALMAYFGQEESKCDFVVRRIKKL